MTQTTDRILPFVRRFKVEKLLKRAPQKLVKTVSEYWKQGKYLGVSIQFSETRASLLSCPVLKLNRIRSIISPLVCLLIPTKSVETIIQENLLIKQGKISLNLHT